MNRGGDTMIGTFTSAPCTSGLGTVTGGLAPIQINGPYSAYVGFLHQGAFGAYFGLEGDNNWRVGGWSYGNASYLVWNGAIINPSTNMRLVYAGDQWTHDQTEYYGGAVMSSLGYTTPDGVNTSTKGRWRYLQFGDSYGNWYGIGYA